ncbi:MAG TPA: Gfo/Idh/MocA family oxidoreductase [Bacteroidia bacterium]|nr:Gfo/Idh/MocA family oxidoreductase [Bacteroidia bacterium]
MKALIIGLGSIAKKHISVLQKNFPNIELHALRSNKDAQSLPGIKNYFSYEEIDFTPSFILICGPTHQHTDVIKNCLRFNCPLFIEKPLSHQLNELTELETLLNQKSIRTYVACNLRFLNCLQFVHDHLKKQKIKVNEVNIYCGSDLSKWRKDADYRHSYSAHADQGGGVHLDLIHELDYTYWLFGSPEKTQRTLKKNSDLEIDSFDYANYLLEYKSFCVNIVLNYYRADAKRCLEIVLENETLYVDLLKNEVRSLTNEKLLFSSDQTILDTYTDQMNYFISKLNETKPYMNAFSEARDILKICIN